MRPAMSGRFNHADAAEDTEYSPENSGGDSPRSDSKIVASTSSSRRSRRAVQKRVVSVPLRDVEGLRLKGDQMSAPPSDSWAWRKYGQKPIKGSPYPRGYYRCSSSKGCPARKQVERSKDDPNTLVVTYSCDHNHPSPPLASSSRNSQQTSAAAAAATAEVEEEVRREEEKPAADPPQPHEDSLPHYKFTSLDGGPSEFEWFTDFESTAVTMLESPIFTDERIAAIDAEMATIFAMREDDESLFAGLGELPECSTVSRRRMAEQEAARRPPSLTTTT